MKTLKIEIPDGYEIDTAKSTFEEIVFKESKKELPKSWEELEQIQGCWVQSNSTLFYDKRETIASEHKNVFKTKEQAQASIALAQLSQLRDVYRQGWRPDWGDESEKYVIKKVGQKLKIYDCRATIHFLSFQSEEIAEQFLNNFKDLIEEASPLLFGE
jgi:hypothetical protein